MAHCTSTQCNQGRRPCTRAACGMPTFRPTFDVEGPHYPAPRVRLPRLTAERLVYLVLGVPGLGYFLGSFGRSRGWW